jgi:hypothetical protein
MGNDSRYHYTNVAASGENNFYRLKMTGPDGSVSFSGVINVKCGETAGSMQVWPNPFTRSVTVSFESKTSLPAIMVLYDAEGKMLSQRKIQIQHGSNLLHYDGLGSLPANTYYLQVVTHDQVMHFKLIKLVN